MKIPDDKKDRVLRFHVSPELDGRVRAVAAENEVRLSTVLRRALEQFLETYEKGKATETNRR